jgi:hypothetical protein
VGKRFFRRTFAGAHAFPGNVVTSCAGDDAGRRSRCNSSPTTPPSTGTAPSDKPRNLAKSVTVE